MFQLLAQVSPEQQTTMVSWLLNQGPLAVILAGLLYIIYRAGVVLFNHVIVPAKDAMLAHLSSVSITMKDMSGSVEKLNSTLECVQQKLSHVDEKTTVIMSECQGFMDESKNDREIIHARLDDLESKVAHVPKVMP